MIKEIIKYLFYGYKSDSVTKAHFSENVRKEIMQVKYIYWLSYRYFQEIKSYCFKLDVLGEENKGEFQNYL